jgi:hypothetical protein
MVFSELQTEQRWTKRKVLKARAALTMHGAETVPTRTVDLGGNGMSVAMPYPMSIGGKGTIKFDLMVEGKVKPISANVHVIYCIYSAGEFKIGFKFLNLDLLVLTAISKFCA